MRRFISLFIALILITACFSGCGRKEITPPPSKSDVTDGTAAGTEDEDAVKEDIVIDTDYCKLRFPGEYGDALTTKTVKEGDSEAVRFYGKAADEEVLLFTLYFNSEEGSYFGSLPVDGGQVPVSYEFSDYVPEDRDNDEQALLFSRMQEDINYIFDDLKEQGMRS